ncbi:MAG TPA: prolyl oligopeptidase family serine peptidase [Gemmatimonadaceae bacterium]|nr:prolyl oligopeptidase family serine peptidase [Gemmatimonadaceae bacterium]
MPPSVRPRSAPALLLPAWLLLASASVAAAQQGEGAPASTAAAAALSSREILAQERYVRPPAAIERLVLAPRQNNVSLSDQSPDRKHFLEPTSDGLPTLAAFGKPHYYLGGLQVDFAANRARSLTTRGATGLSVIDAATGQSRTLETPRGATVSGAAWSPDGTRIAYIANFDDASRLYVADVASGKSRQLTATPLLATLVTDVQWTADGKSVAVVLVPSGRAAEPKRPAIETTPLVRLTEGQKNQERVYASLLRDPYEKALLEYYTTGQLALVDAKSGAVRKIGAPAMIDDVDVAPDGQYLRVTLMQKPFSYIVPYGSFGRVEQLWDARGTVVATLTERPLRVDRPGDDDDQPGPGGRGADTARRDFGWLPDGSGLYYLQQDPAPAGRGGRAGGDSGDSAAAPDAPAAGGSAGRGAARRKDRLFAWRPPYDANSRTELLASDNRIGGVLFSDDAKTVFVAENANGTGHLYAVKLDEPTKHYTLWRMRGLTASVGGRGRGFGGRGGNGADSLTFYQNPGNLVTTRGRLGQTVALLSSDGQSVFLNGTQYARDWQHEAPRPFVDRVDIATGRKTRLFQSAADVYEDVVAPLDADFARMIITRESRTMLPDAYLRDTRSGQVVKLTNNVDYMPEFTQAIRKKIPVTRVDGIRFFVDLTLPRDYTAGTRLPAMLWFYPREYTEQAEYDRTLRTENVNEFPSGGPRTIEYLVTQGYAVVNFSPPIMGDQGRMNDNYIADLRNNLAAVIDELDRQGYIDRTRLAIGGHSYGAFSTVNAMTHTPFFKAGIAGDGMYNRSLTPNGFQSERRDFWEAQETYLEMSPFLEADKLQGALLMYHSIEDQNVGTAPISSIRMMQALQGLGKTAALYMYPYEDHGPATAETILDQWARWVAWLGVYVKNAGTPGTTNVTTKAISQEMP